MDDDDEFDMTTHSYSDEESVYLPTWFSAARYCVDFTSLREQEIEKLIVKHLPSSVQGYTLQDGHCWAFHYPEISLRISKLTSTFPCSVTYEVENRTLPRKVVDSLRQSLRGMLTDQSSEHQNGLEVAMMVLRMLEESSSTLLAWRSKLSTQEVIANTTYQDEEDPYVADRSSCDPLKTSPEEICAGISDKFSVLNVEKITRSDLWHRFERKRSSMRHKLMSISTDELNRFVPRQHRPSNKDDKELLVDFLVQPRLTFHGTQTHLVRSIVRWGFIVPGEKIGDTEEFNQVRCGSTYGSGVYSSPDPDFALHYSGNSSFAAATEQKHIPGLRLIACATVMGRALQMKNSRSVRGRREALSGTDSHISNDAYQFIVFDTAQILPCFVIHLDLATEHARRSLQLVPRDPEIWVYEQKKAHHKINRVVLGPGDKLREKQAKKAAAAKWFPFGFGPAKTNALVIEAIGDIDDDEENYGDYQTDRLDGAGDGEEGCFSGSKLRNRKLDQYQDAR